MSRTVAHVLLLLLGMGEALSLYLTYIHYRLHREPWWHSVCAINERVNCDVVILSPYGAVAGMPLSLWAVWFYALLLGVTAIGLRRSPVRFPRSPAAVVLTGAAVATGISLVLATLSVTSVGSFCLLCAGLYAINGALLVIAWLGVRSTGESPWLSLKGERAHWAQNGFPTAVAIAVGVCTLFAVRLGYSRGTVGGSEICGSVAVATRGGSAEPIQVKVFSDFQCSHCAALNDDLRRLRGNRRVQVIDRPYPLDPECNPNVKQTHHTGACLQALAALCAEEQGVGAEFHDRLFAEGDRLRSELVGLAASVRLDGARFERCLDADGALGRVRQSVDEADALGVKATPTVFVNGRMHVGRLSADDIQCLALAGPSQRL